MDMGRPVTGAEPELRMYTCASTNAMLAWSAGSFVPPKQMGFDMDGVHSCLQRLQMHSYLQFPQ